jgi:putative endonuclease
MYFIYILKCSDNTLYTGSTNDLDKRIEAHNAGKGAKYTRGRGPVIMIYYEKFRSKNKALKREWEIKALNRKQKQALMIRDTVGAR